MFAAKEAPSGVLSALVLATCCLHLTGPRQHCVELPAGFNVKVAAHVWSNSCLCVWTLAGRPWCKVDLLKF